MSYVSKIVDALKGDRSVAEADLKAALAKEKADVADAVKAAEPTVAKAVQDAVAAAEAVLLDKLA